MLAQEIFAVQVSIENLACCRRVGYDCRSGKRKVCRWRKGTADIVSDLDTYRSLMKEYKTLTPIIEKFREYKSTEKECADLKEMLDERWTAIVQQTGVMCFSLNGGVESDYTDKANALNSQEIVLAALPKSPTSGAEKASALFGCVAPKALNDPAKPLHNYAVAGVVAPRRDDREDYYGNNRLLKSGCAPMVAAEDGSGVLIVLLAHVQACHNYGEDGFTVVALVVEVFAVVWAEEIKDTLCSFVCAERIEEMSYLVLEENDEGQGSNADQCI